MNNESKAAILCVVASFLYVSVIVAAEDPLDVLPEEEADLNSSNVDVAMRTIGSNSTHSFLVDCEDGVSPWNINSTNYNESRFSENCWVEAVSKSGKTLNEKKFR